MTSPNGPLHGVEMLEAMVEVASDGHSDLIVGRPIQDLLSETGFDATFIGAVVATGFAVSRTYDLAGGRNVLVQGRPVAAGPRGWSWHSAMSRTSGNS
jgi:hypothetical protein